MKYVKSFKELEVYKLARELARDIFEITRKFPREERYSLTDQLRRASRSVESQIAESWGKRRYEKHFVLKLTDSDSEQYETQHFLEVANDCSYIDTLLTTELVKKCESIGKMLNSMMNKASLFCQQSKQT